MDTVIYVTKRPELCSLRYCERADSQPPIAGKGIIEISQWEFGRPYPTGLILLGPVLETGTLTIKDREVFDSMRLERYPHLRQINRLSGTDYELIVTCYQWTPEQIEAFRRCLLVSADPTPAIDYAIRFRVDRGQLAMGAG